MPAVGQLDQDGSYVLDGSEDELAERLRLGLIPAHVLVLADLGHAVDEIGDVLPETLDELVARRQRVLQDVVQHPSGHTGGVEPEIREGVGDLDRMGEVGLAGAPLLISVLLGGEIEDPRQEVLVNGLFVFLEPANDIPETDLARQLDGQLPAVTGETLTDRGHGRSIYLDPFAAGQCRDRPGAAPAPVSSAPSPV